jgi:deoxyribose-phosphate aldolase
LEHKSYLDEILLLAEKSAGPVVARQILSLMDLTSLNDDGTTATIDVLCQKAVTAHGHVAAVCVLPPFVRLAAEKLAKTAVKIATVANFPSGAMPFENVSAVMTQAIADGAHEVDVVFPYEIFLAGDREHAREFLRLCKDLCGEKVLLKIILETGALQDSQHVANASADAILAGADFIKTSTGKIKVGATLEATVIMLMKIKDMTPTLGRTVGIKISGGVRTFEQAAQYLMLANRVMGSDWVSPQTFRFGSSQLLDVVLKLC